MRTYRHPAFAEITVCVADDKGDEYEAAGWISLLSDEQQTRYEEIELEADLSE